MTRIRKMKAAWTYCEQCGKAETKIAKSIHGGLYHECCDELIYRKSASVRNLNNEFYYPEFIQDDQMSYGIAWGVE